MKKIILVLFLNLVVQAASITVEPFKINFFVNDQAYELDFKITLACRYEKFVFGDSAQYEYKYKELPIAIAQNKISSSITHFSMSLNKLVKHELTGYFKHNKECQSIIELFLIDKKYSTGFLNDFKRPIKLGFYKQTRLEEFKSFEIEHIKNLLENKVYGFKYDPGYNNLWVYLTSDGEIVNRMSTFARMQVAKDPQTDMPFKIKKGL